MKTLSKIFFDILVKLDKGKNANDIIKKYFFDIKNYDDKKIKKLADYFVKFKDFCFDLDVNNMLNGSINFIYKN
jgi:hypothetical protein